ncbi:MAG TPA: tetratricopeptide repeat protein [Mobilitalea sp.]|nr:tetratricopeptide repeat protein [Mobilitalea sp.]
MLCGVLLTKERKIAAAGLLLIIIITGLFVLYRYSVNKKYEEQTVMAEKFLKEGNYEQAVEAYLKALSMRSSEQESLAIGLSEAYLGVDDYDKALEVLRICYQKTSGAAIKEKIEEVTSRKTDYEYLQSISRAEKYYSNEEYDKAITEYKKAKLIKSKEITSYKRIAEAYIKKNDYNSARQEVMEGLAITQDDELNKLLDMVDTYLLQKQYIAIVKEAEEYIYQENYDNGMDKYEEAIGLMPMGLDAYKGLGEAYITCKEYQKAITLLQDAVKKVGSNDLNDLLNEATNLKAAEDDRKRILSELYTSFNILDIKKITELLNNTYFKDTITKDVPIYCSSLGENGFSNGTGLIIYNSNTAYYGEIKDRMKKGIGIYFTLLHNDAGQGYYYYEGEWDNDIPNGKGMTAEEAVVLDNNKEVSKMVTTDGIYEHGIENGTMHRYFYTDGKETGNITYKTSNGRPLPMLDENSQPIPTEDGKPYVIAMIYQGDKVTDKTYKVEPNTLWGVKPFIVGTK